MSSSISLQSNDSRLNDNCAICFETLKEGSEGDRDLMLNTACSHIFHKKCLKQHMETPSDYNSGAKTCPQCRGALSIVSILHPDSTGAYKEVEQTAAAVLPIGEGAEIADGAAVERFVDAMRTFGAERRARRAAAARRTATTRRIIPVLVTAMALLVFSRFR